ncbi:hypothetical protein ACIRCZ_19000 [Leifsonia sp. NPDC102414]|uniref:hypothetical protein n=1 Tax=Leifsonia sp. NPDC102414 TaxID=3364124 RepID=UPI0037F417FF
MTTNSSSVSVATLTLQDLRAATHVTLTRNHGDRECREWTARLWAREQQLSVDMIQFAAGAALSEVVAIATTFYGAHQILIALPWQHTNPDSVVAIISRV